MPSNITRGDISRAGIIICSLALLRALLERGYYSREGLIWGKTVDMAHFNAWPIDKFYFKPQCTVEKFVVPGLRVNVLLQTERRSSKAQKISKCTFQTIKFSLRHKWTNWNCSHFCGHLNILFHADSWWIYFTFTWKQILPLKIYIHTSIV